MFFSKKQAFIIPGHCIAVQADKSYNVMYTTAMMGLRELPYFSENTNRKYSNSCNGLDRP
jgi:hypothetical protein